ncbi:MAG: hypothetical protein SCARUB_02205 [Candidatus Scalindua rubra]|uniref:Uncharacterized protein n=1 Tax=Candidatus Scalindua rubra TaxID=1872076 RepID=A0A1E3XAN0_9BACT|nr:MAG: hypothetical protein SCARUB_02205 [Candidatus Scalindua rubra]
MPSFHKDGIFFIIIMWQFDSIGISIITTYDAIRYILVILSETERSEESLVSKPMMFCEVSEVSIKRFFGRSSLRMTC